MNCYNSSALIGGKFILKEILYKIFIPVLNPETFSDALHLLVIGLVANEYTKFEKKWKLVTLSGIVLYKNTTEPIIKSFIWFLLHIITKIFSL